VNEPPYGKFYIRRGYGRRTKALWVVRPSADHIPAEEWEACREAALAAEHSLLTAADLDGATIGEAFLRWVIQDPKVQATSKWLVLECPQFAELYEKGLFPFLIPERPRRNRTRVLTPPVKLGCEDLKKRWGLLPADPHARANPGPGSVTSGVSPTLTRRTDWPVQLDEDELTAIFRSQYHPRANYQDDPTEGPICRAAKALANRHCAFFDLLRNKELIASGIFKQTGLEQDVPAGIFKLHDVYLDIECDELRRSQNETAAPVVTHELLIVRLANAAGVATTTANAAAQVSSETFTGSLSPPSPPQAQDASVPPLTGKKRGRRETVSVRVAMAMKLDLEKGRLSPKELEDMIEKALTQKYDASRNTCRKVRRAVLSGINHFPRK
jgi:hypothetical protein